MISSARRDEIVGALRRGTVPNSGLDVLAVGIETFAATLDEELAAVVAGRGGFKAVRGEYGTGKTFFGRWLQERGRACGFATSEVQINETETPLHKLETVYRRLTEHLISAQSQRGALRSACGLYGLLQVCAAVWLNKITLHRLGHQGEIGCSDADADLRQTLVSHIAAYFAIALVVPQQHNQG